MFICMVRHTRGKSDVPRTELLRVRMTPDEYAVADKAAEERGQALGAFAAEGLSFLIGLGDDPLVKADREKRLVELAKLRAELVRVGNNLNQLALLFNSGKAVGSRDWLKVLADCDEAIERVDVGVEEVIAEDPKRYVRRLK